jgi:hypothetical protein
MALGLFRKKTEAAVQRTPAQVSKFLEDFLNGAGPKWEWDDFLSTPVADTELEKIRERCRHLDLEFPPNKPSAFCSDQGFTVIRGFVDQLRRGTAAGASR